MVGDIQDQVLTHDCQTNEAEITTGNDPRGSADIDAGQTGATVSPWIQSTQVITDRRDRNARTAIETIPISRILYCRGGATVNWDLVTHTALSAIVGFDTDST